MSRNLTSRYLRETEIALARAVAISDVTRIARVACGYRMTVRSNAEHAICERLARDVQDNYERIADGARRVLASQSWAAFSDDERTEVSFTPSDRAWFKRPLRALAFALAVACGGSAARADAPVHSPEVAAAQHEVITAKAHLKDARAHERTQRKQASAAKKVAKLRAALAKAEGK